MIQIKPCGVTVPAVRAPRSHRFLCKASIAGLPEFDSWPRTWMECSGAGKTMFQDEGAILQAAAILAASQHAMNAAVQSGGKRYNDSSVDVLVNILRDMETKGLIPAGLVPAR